MSVDFTEKNLPIILVRGFGGVDISDEVSLTYQGFNQGTVYPRKTGEDYIYEGMILRFVKSVYQYHDATNAIGYYSTDLQRSTPKEWYAELEQKIKDRVRFKFLKEHFEGQLAVDARVSKDFVDDRSTLWVYRYYDFAHKVDPQSANAKKNRRLEFYGEKLKCLIKLVKAITGASKVNLIAHSMGGLIVRAAIQWFYKNEDESTKDINRIVTLGTPHGGISFQILERAPSDAKGELYYFNKNNLGKTLGINRINHFPADRCLCVIGTNYLAYRNEIGTWIASVLNNLGQGLGYNRSDGLVKQKRAYIEGAHKAYVHKCHGGRDSLVTSREAYELATRFFFGDRKVTIRFLHGRIKNYETGWLDRTEYWIGFSLKPRGVDFFLNYQSAEAENCFGPFKDNALNLRDGSGKFENKVVYEGFLNSRLIRQQHKKQREKDLAFRFDIYVGERDGVFNHTDDEVLNAKAKIYVHLEPELQIYFSPHGADKREKADKIRAGVYEFDARYDHFEARFRVEIEKFD